MCSVVSFAGKSSIDLASATQLHIALTSWLRHSTAIGYLKFKAASGHGHGHSHPAKQSRHEIGLRGRQATGDGGHRAPNRKRWRLIRSLQACPPFDLYSKIGSGEKRKQSSFQPWLLCCCWSSLASACAVTTGRRAASGWSGCVCALSIARQH